MWKIADFGLSHDQRKNGRIFERRGTPGYMSPELKHRIFKSNGDTYSVGVTIIQCLTGIFPSGACTDVSDLFCVPSGEETLIRDVVSNFDDIFVLNPLKVSQEMYDAIHTMISSEDYCKY